MLSTKRWKNLIRNRWNYPPKEHFSVKKKIIYLILLLSVKIYQNVEII